MGTDEKIVCRLCLEICEGGFEVVGKATQEALDFILLKLDLNISNEAILCNSCGHNLKKCFDFKINCLHREHQIFLPLKDEGSTEINEPTTRLCYFCVTSVEDGQFEFLENKDINMTVMLEQFFPEVVLNLTDESITCMLCYKTLQSHLTFISNCLRVEERIRKYCETEGTNSNGQIELNSVLQFTSKNALQNENISDSVNTLKLEQCFEYIGSENAQDALKVENFVEIEKLDLDIKESYTDPKSEEDWCNRLQQNTPPLERLNRPALPAKVFKTRIYNCRNCPYKAKQKRDLQIHTSIHKNYEDITWYKCKVCTFQTIYQRSLARHMLNHKSATEVAMHNCKMCLYQSRHRSHLQKHMLTHRRTSEVTTYKCETCVFQTKYKSCLQQHMLTHKKTSEVTVYTCEICLFETKRKNSLKVHMLSHKSNTEVPIYKCELCLCQTKYKGYFKQHMLSHASASGLEVYKCDICSYQTKRTGVLERHMLNHKNGLEATMHKCDVCNYETKYKDVFRRHQMIHKSSAEVQMYKCENCAYQSKHKYDLQKHMLAHKRPSEVKMFQCEMCAYQSKYNSNLRKHRLTHKDV